MALYVHDVGSKVEVASDVEAVVRQVRIGEGRSISYLVAWWHEGSLKEEWVYGSEIPPPGERRLVIEESL